MVGTVFYLSVVNDSDALLTSLPDEDQNKRYVDKESLPALLLADIIPWHVKECYAQSDDLITEIFVGQGNVNFTNITSNLSYNVNGGSGSYANGQGALAQPEILPLDLQNRMTAGFDEEGDGKNSGKNAKKGEARP
ncbi:MAG: hypothetical protein ABH843_01830 [Candidatus Omnitrophota bacterium]